MPPLQFGTVKADKLRPQQVIQMQRPRLNLLNLIGCVEKSGLMIYRLIYHHPLQSPENQ